MTEAVDSRERLIGSKNIIIFIGPEGSGKTTIAKQLAEEIGKPYITTGDTIRWLAANDHGVWGDKCRRMFAEHAYLDGPTLLEILVDRFKKPDTKNGFILDGGLRTLEETIDFQHMLEMANRALPVMVVHMRMPAWMSFERLVDGRNARKRDDDTYEGVMSRLEKYFFKFEQRIAVIKKNPNWNIVQVDATAPVEMVMESVLIKTGEK